MKQITSLFITLLLSLSMISGVLAQQADPVMKDRYGVIMRTAQLEERLDRALLYGNDIISYLDSKSVDTSQLRSIVDQLGALKPQVQAIDPDACIKSPEQFVTLKKQAIDLVSQFRVEARKLLKDTEISDLKKSIALKEPDRLKERRVVIEKARKDYLSQHISSTVCKA